MKTAGTSFVFQLREHFAPNEVYPSESIDRRNNMDFAAYVSIRRLMELSPERRAEIRMYTGHFPFVASQLVDPNLTTLTILRDPVERTISVLKHFKRLSKIHRAHEIEEIYNDPFVFAHFIENHQTRMFGVTAADQPEAFGSTMDYWSTAWMLGIGNPNYDPDNPPQIDPETAMAAAKATAIDEHRFECAKQSLASVDVIGLSDRYDEFISELRERFGWWPAGIDTKKKANLSHEPWTGSKELRDRIAADNAYEIEFYEYAKELVDRRRKPRPALSVEPAQPPDMKSDGARARGQLRRQIRSRHPKFFTAVIADARIAASYRSERARFRGRVDALLQVLRLMSNSDAFLALVLYRAKARLQSLGVPVLPSIAHHLAMAIAQVCIGDPVVVQPGIYLAHGQVVIDGLTEIRRGVVIFPWVTVGLRAGDIRGPIVGRDVHIGTGAKLIGPITVHRGARVGANSVVVRDVPAGVTVVGAPARPVRN